MRLSELLACPLHTQHVYHRKRDLSLGLAGIIWEARVTKLSVSVKGLFSTCTMALPYSMYACMLCSNLPPHLINALLMSMQYLKGKVHLESTLWTLWVC